VTLELNLSLGHVGVTLENDVELQGVVVAHVHPNDLAARAGMRPGDVICALNDVPVTHHGTATEIIKNCAGSTLSISYWPATEAESERQRVAHKGGTRPKREWKTWSNAILVVVCFLYVRSSWLLWHAAPSDSLPELSPEKRAELQQLQAHQAKDQLLDQLHLISQSTAHFLAQNHSGEALELQQPGLLYRLLGSAMQLQYYLNLTASLGLEGEPQNTTEVANKFQRLVRDEMAKRITHRGAAQRGALETH
jgi:hypothetical protein